MIGFDWSRAILRGGTYIKRLRRAISFKSETDFLRALRLLEDLSEETPVDYDVVTGSYVIAMPVRILNLLTPALKHAGVHFEDVEVVSLNQLSPEEQARRRGLIRRRNIA